MSRAPNEEDFAALQRANEAAGAAQATTTHNPTRAVVSTSLTAVAASTRATSLDCPAKTAGMASWYATTSAATSRASRWASPRRGAWRTHPMQFLEMWVNDEVERAMDRGELSGAGKVCAPILFARRGVREMPV